MELYLDTSDVAAVKKLARIFPLAGVTTNPSIDMYVDDDSHLLNF